MDVKGDQEKLILKLLRFKKFLYKIIEFNKVWL